MNIRALITTPGRSQGRAVSLYDELPHADAMPRSLPRVEQVAAADIIGTTRHPSTLTDAFLPLPYQRTQHWRHDFGRILAAFDDLAILPPVDLLKVCGRYFVVDGHKRVAAAKRVRAIVDAIVVDVRPPGCADVTSLTT